MESIKKEEKGRWLIICSAITFAAQVPLSIQFGT